MTTEQFVTQAPWRTWTHWSASTPLLDRLRHLSKTTKLPGTDNKIAAVEHLTANINVLDDIATTVRDAYATQTNALYAAYTATGAQATPTSTPTAAQSAASMPIAPNLSGFNNGPQVTRSQTAESRPHDISTLSHLPYNQAVARAGTAHEALLYTRIIAASCPNPKPEIIKNKSTSLGIIENEVITEWEKSIANSDTIYESACGQETNVMLYKWAAALFDTYRDATLVANNPSTGTTELPPTRPQAASKRFNDATMLEKLLKTVLMRHCPERVQSDIERATSRADSWTWDTITKDLYFSKTAEPTNATAAPRPQKQVKFQNATANVAADATTKASETETNQAAAPEPLALIASQMEKMNNNFKSVIDQSKRTRNGSDDNPSPRKRNAGFGNNGYKERYDSSTIPCRDFARGNCTYGNSCKFNHNFCKKFAAGVCTRTNCRYPHIEVPNAHTRAPRSNGYQNNNNHRTSYQQRNTYRTSHQQHNYSQQREACRNFANGHCRFSNCKYSHDAQPAQPRTPAQPPATGADSALANVLISALQRTIPPPQHPTPTQPQSAQQLTQQLAAPPGPPSTPHPGMPFA